MFKSSIRKGWFIIINIKSIFRAYLTGYTHSVTTLLLHSNSKLVNDQQSWSVVISFICIAINCEWHLVSNTVSNLKIDVEKVLFKPFPSLPILMKTMKESRRQYFLYWKVFPLWLDFIDLWIFYQLQRRSKCAAVGHKHCFVHWLEQEQ